MKAQIQDLVEACNEMQTAVEEDAAAAASAPRSADTVNAIAGACSIAHVRTFTYFAFLQRSRIRWRARCCMRKCY